MTALSKPARGTDDTLSTAVRQATPTDLTAGESVESMSGRRDYPLESWDADEAPESELPVATGELGGLTSPSA